MRFLFASDSFKGTLSSERIIELLSTWADKIFPGCETLGVPIADGGEGTVDAVITVTKGAGCGSRPPYGNGGKFLWCLPSRFRYY